MSVQEAIKILSEALNSDEDYKNSWKANIVMCMHDEERTRNGILPHEWPSVFNGGAERFLKLLSLPSDNKAKRIKIVTNDTLRQDVSLSDYLYNISIQANGYIKKGSMVSLTLDLKE